MRVYYEDWAAAYGSPYLAVEDGTGDGHVEVVEDDGQVRSHVGRGPGPDKVAFVDGVRRVEATLYLDPGDATMVRGAAGAHAFGAVLSQHPSRPLFARCQATRLVVWGSGQRVDLPTVAGGWSWQAASVASDAPDAPLQEIQSRMRQAEGRLAEELCEEGWLTIVDGPLNFVRSRDLPVIGLVKTHHRPLLPADQHVRVTGLAPAERCSIFRKRQDIYSCYLRLAAGSRHAGPWSGIVRLEMPASAGLAAATDAADLAAAALPRYAGVAHIDPRAPQNLQPVGALETHLKHLLGDQKLAARAVRAAVDELASRAATGANR